MFFVIVVVQVIVAAENFVVHYSVGSGTLVGEEEQVSIGSVGYSGNLFQAGLEIAEAEAEILA